MKSKEELTEMALAGDADAQYDLAAGIATGSWDNSTPTPENLKSARNWYTKAAVQGHAGAQYNLGFMILLGEGGMKDSNKALEWLTQAAAQKQYDAVKLLAQLYEEGLHGVLKDEGRSKLFRMQLDKLDAEV